MSTPLEHTTHGLSDRDLALALFGKYTILASYGIWAALVEIPTFKLVGSAMFATVWAATVAVLSVLALVGILRTWMTGRFRLEKWTTFMFVCVFLGYSYALVWRALSTANWDAAPLALIPLAVCVLPTIRWAELVRRRVAA